MIGGYPVQNMQAMHQQQAQQFQWQQQVTASLALFVVLLF